MEGVEVVGGPAVKAMTEKAPNATITYREDITEDLWIIQVSPDGGEVPPFQAGQYAELALPDSEGKISRRPYSIASAASVRSYVEAYLVLVPDGYLTPKLWSMPVGGRVWLGPKIKGKFTLEEVPPGKDLVMISTGTGLAPFMSMLREYRGKDRWRRLVMIQCARYARDLGYREELEAAAVKDPSIIYIPTVTREAADSGWCGCRGRVQSVLEPQAYESFVGAPLDPAECQVLICGNPEMIDETQVLLESRGFRQHSRKNPGNIHFERFW